MGLLALKTFTTKKAKNKIQMPSKFFKNRKCYDEAAQRELLLQLDHRLLTTVIYESEKKNIGWKISAN